MLEPRGWLREAPGWSDSAPPVMEVRGLVKRYGDRVAVDGIDLNVLPGECLGLLGPNGAGKSTTMELLEGLQAPTEGVVRLFGLSWEKDGAKLRSRIGVVPQEASFLGRLRVHETVQLFGSFYSPAVPVEALLERVGLQEQRRTYVMHLSGGQRQRLSLAVALAGEPKLLFLDEPTAGLDPQARRELWQLIETLKASGRSVVLTTHHLEEAQRLCDHVVILQQGRIVVEGAPARLIATLGGGQFIDVEAGQDCPPEMFAGIPTLLTFRSRAAAHSLHVRELHRAMPELLERVRTRGIALRSLSTREATLDDVFEAATGQRLNGVPR